MAAIAAQLTVPNALFVGGFYGGVRGGTTAAFSFLKSRDGALERARGAGLGVRMRWLQVILCIGLLLVGF